MRAEQWVGVASGALNAWAGQSGGMLGNATGFGTGFVANGLNYDDDGNNDSTKRLKIY